MIFPPFPIDPIDSRGLSRIQASQPIVSFSFDRFYGQLRAWNASCPLYAGRCLKWSLSDDL